MSKFEKVKNKSIKEYQLSSHKAWLNVDGTLKLDWNESTRPVPTRVKEALIVEIEQGKLNWYPNVNNERLRAKIAEYCKVEADNTQYFASSDALHEYIALAFVEECDRILVVGPTYDNFRAVVAAAGAKVQFYNSVNEETLEIDPRKLCEDLSLIQPKVVYLVNPNNPSGHLYKRSELELLIRSHDNILFVIDEAYFEFSGMTCAPLVGEAENLIISRTFSKAFGLASFRIGYCLAHRDLIDPLNRVRNAKNVSHLAQVAALAILDDTKLVHNYVEEIIEQRDLLILFLGNFPRYCPLKSNANFIAVYVESKQKELIKFLERRNVFIRDYGHLEQTKNLIRITIGNEEEMAQFKALISEFEAKQNQLA